MFVQTPAGRVAVEHDADVVVVGAGPGGFAAALQAARMDLRVVLVERFDLPGGVHTSGLQGAARPYLSNSANPPEPNSRTALR